MARKRISIDVKIERQKDIVSKAKDKYEAELSVLEELMQKRRGMQSKELMKVIENSDRSYEEIITFLSNKQAREVSKNEEKNICNNYHLLNQYYASCRLRKYHRSF